MKALKIISLFVITLTIFSCTVDMSKNEKNSLADEGILGRVKCMTTKFYDGVAVLGEFQKKGIRKKQVEFYNRIGNIT